MLHLQRLAVYHLLDRNQSMATYGNDRTEYNARSKKGKGRTIRNTVLYISTPPNNGRVIKMISKSEKDRIIQGQLKYDKLGMEIFHCKAGIA